VSRDGRRPLTDGLEARIGRAADLLCPQSAAVPDERADSATPIGAEPAHAASVGPRRRTAHGGSGDAAATAPDPRRKAIELLTRREHSRRELIRKLADRGVAPEEADAAVATLSRQGWQDDARYAAALARTRAQGGYGPLRIRAELRLQGVDEATIQAALDACEVGWGEAARQLAMRRFGGCRGASAQERARRGAFLQRRGFGMDDIRQALAAGEGEDES